MKYLTPLAVALALFATMVGCTKNLATGRSQFDMMSTDKEIALGTEAQPQFINENGGEVPSPQIVKYVSDLGQQLAAASERPELPWEFHVLDTGIINAFALPGGKVFMTRGLMSKMTNEAQLAGVLGHEIGHVTAEHTDERMSQAMIVQGIAIGAGVAGEVADEDWLKILGVGTSVAGTGFLLKFSRDQESEADMLGLRYMTALGYNPRGQVQVMHILKEASGGGGGPEFLATHPLPQTRIDRLNSIISQQYPNADTSSAYDYKEQAFQKNILQPMSKLPPPAKKAADFPAEVREHLAKR